MYQTQQRTHQHRAMLTAGRCTRDRCVGATRLCLHLANKPLSQFNKLCHSNLGIGRVPTPGGKIHSQPPSSIVQPYLPGGTNVGFHLLQDSLSPPHSYPKRQLDRVSRFSTIHARYQRTDRQNDDGTRPVRQAACSTCCSNSLASFLHMHIRRETLQTADTGVSLNRQYQIQSLRLTCCCCCCCCGCCC